MASVVIIDNYDSFTYNLVDLVRRFTRPLIYRNDEITAEEIAALSPAGVLISPGPGRPVDSNVSMTFAQKYHTNIPILGVCLGHQLLGHIFGVEVAYAAKPMHGKCSLITHNGKGIFEGLQNPLEVMRYHSLILKQDTKWPEDLDVTAETSSGELMALQHKTLPLTGLQFHPESILTQGGERMIQNWLISLGMDKSIPPFSQTKHSF